MKKTASSTIDSNFNKEINSNFRAVSVTTFRVKSDFIAMCSQISYLSQEKLPIIYANIRV